MTYVYFEDIINIIERPKGLIIEFKDNQKIPIAKTFEDYEEIVQIIKARVVA